MHDPQITKNPVESQTSALTYNGLEYGGIMAVRHHTAIERGLDDVDCHLVAQHVMLQNTLDTVVLDVAEIKFLLEKAEHFQGADYDAAVRRARALTATQEMEDQERMCMFKGSRMLSN